MQLKFYEPQFWIFFQIYLIGSKMPHKRSNVSLVVAKFNNLMLIIKRSCLCLSYFYCNKPFLFISYNIVFYMISFGYIEIRLNSHTILIYYNIYLLLYLLQSYYFTLRIINADGVAS